MGSALIEGACKAGFIRPSQIRVYDPDRARVKALRKRAKVAEAKSAAEAVKGAQFVFLCVKPQQMMNALGEIAPNVDAKQCLVSIVAGIRAAKIEQALSKPAGVIRVMPNTPALVRSGVSVLTRGRHATPRQLAFAKRFFQAVGEAIELPEEHFDAVTALSGSGPAYLFFLAEAMQKAGTEMGLPPAVAETLARGTLSGAAKMLTPKEAPSELRRKVTSPGGTTEAAIRTLEQQQWAQHFIEAVLKARDRSKELSSS